MTSNQTGLIEGPDGALRCAWHGNDDFYRDYHDHEWGRPVSDDHRLFEKICLEGFQSGLSWITILRKRENFREAFDSFRFERIAYFSERDVERLLGNAGIVRHRGKIESVINNAKRAKTLIDEAGSLARFFWRFEPGPKERPRRVDYQTLLANTTSPASINLSGELKKRGWTFVGPTTVYAFMQAMGLVNDHLEGCVCRTICELERKQFRRP